MQLLPMTKKDDGYERYNLTPKGATIDGIAKDRLRAFIGGGQFESLNLVPLLFDGRASGPGKVDLEVYSAPKLTRPFV